MIPSALSVRVGCGITAVIVVIVTLHGAFLAQHLPLMGIEDAALSHHGPAYTALRALITAMCGDQSAAVRWVSVACLALAVLATARLGARATGDEPAGAFLALGWALFPPVHAVMSLATPIAPAAALIGWALVYLWPVAAGTAARGGWNRDGCGALLLTLAAVVDESAAWGVLAAAILLLLMRPGLWSLLAPAMGAALAMGAILLDTAFAFTADWVDATRDPFLFGLLLPFGMLWVGAALGAVASRAAGVQARLGTRQIWVTRMAPLLFLGLILLRSRGSPNPGAAYLAAGTAFFVLGLLGVLPLIVWVRTVMPRIRSLSAWLAFPVIMYSCFWVVLGPVRLDRFPYRQAITASPQPESR